MGGDATKKLTRSQYDILNILYIFYLFLSRIRGQSIEQYSGILSRSRHQKEPHMYINNSSNHAMKSEP